MRRLIAAEWRKLGSTRLWLWLLLASVALTVVFCLLAIAFGDDPDNPTPPLSSASGQRTVFSVGFGGAGALVAILGAVGMTTEFRHRTATATFLATPDRGRVVLAKLIAYALVGAGFGAICVLATIAVALPYLDSKGITVSLTGNGIPTTLLAVVVAVTLYAVIGVGLGAVLRDQVATAAGLLVYLFVVEPMVTRIGELQNWAKFLPGAASNAFTHISQAGQVYLTPWLGGVVLAGYAGVLAAAGLLLTARRDIS